MANYKEYSKELYESRRNSNEYIPDSVLRRDSIVEILERRQLSLDGVDEHYTALKNQAEQFVEGEELRLSDDGIQLSIEEVDELYEKHYSSIGMNELEEDRNIISENMNVMEEEHFEQILTLNLFLNDFERYEGYKNFEVVTLDEQDPLINVQTFNNDKKFKLELLENDDISKDTIPDDRITTIIQAEFNEPVDIDMPADLIFTDFMNNRQYTLAFSRLDDDENSDYCIWLNSDDDEAFLIEDLFNVETTEKIKEAINNGETIHVDNPEQWFDFENKVEMFNYMMSEGLSNELDDNVYLYINDNKLHLNGLDFAAVDNDTIEISPYDYEKENMKDIINDKIYNLNSPVANFPLHEVGLERLENDKNNVITIHNDNNAKEKVKSLVLSTSAVEIDKELMNGTYELYSSFSEYYNDKFNVESNDMLKSHFKDRFGEIEEHREGLSQHLNKDPNTVDTNFYTVHDSVNKNIDESRLNLPPLQLPKDIRKDIEGTFNRYKNIAKDEIRTVFNNLHQYEDNSNYINAVSLKKIDETYLETLDGKKTNDYYNGMKDYAKLNNPEFFSNDKQEQREKSLENVHTIKSYLSNKGTLDTTIDLDKNRLSTKDEKVSFTFSDIEKEPQKCLDTFESYSKENKKKNDISIDM